MTFRMRAAVRRGHVLRAAMHEFGQAGFDSVSVTTIAERAGVSQPYVFRLFGTKKDLFIATIEERTAQILATLRTAVADAAPDMPPLGAMAAAYTELMEHDPLALRSLVYAWSATTDDEIAAAARASYLGIWRLAAALSGEEPRAVRDFMAHGTMLTVLDALGIGAAAPDADSTLSPELWHQLTE